MNNGYQTAPPVINLDNPEIKLKLNYTFSFSSPPFSKRNNGTATDKIIPEPVSFELDLDAVTMFAEMTTSIMLRCDVAKANEFVSKIKEYVSGIDGYYQHAYFGMQLTIKILFGDSDDSDYFVIKDNNLKSSVPEVITMNGDDAFILVSSPTFPEVITSEGRPLISMRPVAEYIDNKFSDIRYLSTEIKTTLWNIYKNRITVKKNNQQEEKTDADSVIAKLMEKLASEELAIFPEKILKYYEGVECDEIFKDLVGLSEIKKEIRKFEAQLKYNRILNKRNIPVREGNSMHMCFLGNPGTGKTTVARAITQMLYKNGIVRKNACIEVNATDLRANYTGQTKTIVNGLMRMASGGVLFIDEAYGLLDTHRTSSASNFSKEAVAALLKKMEDDRGDIVVILAGYSKEMSEMLELNQGMKSRINKYFVFPDYSDLDLFEIFVKLAYKNDMEVSDAALIKTYNFLKDARKLPNFSNARFIRNYFEKIQLEHTYNYFQTKDLPDQDKRVPRDIIMAADITDKIMNELINTLKDGGKYA